MMVSTEDAYAIQGAFEPGYAAIYTVCPVVAGVITSVPSLYTFHLIDPLVPLLKSKDSEGIVGEVPVFEEEPPTALVKASLFGPTTAVEGYVAEASEEHPKKAPSPTVKTPGKEMDVMAVFSANAYCPILVTVLAIE